MNDSRTLPVRRWVLALERIQSNDLAIDAWLAVVRAQGWSPVGEPEVINRPQYAEFGVVGGVVQYAGLTVAAGVDSVRVP